MCSSIHQCSHWPCCGLSLDYVPVVSTVIAIQALILKGIHLFSTATVSSEAPEATHYFKSLENKHLGRTLFILVPVLGNILVILGDYLLSRPSSAKIYMCKLSGNLHTLSEDLQRDGSFLFELIQDQPRVIRQLTQEQIELPAFRECIQKNGGSLITRMQDPSNQDQLDLGVLARDYEMMKYLVQQKGDALYYIQNNEEMQDIEMCVNAIKNDLQALNYVCDRFLNHPEILQAIDQKLQEPHVHEWLNHYGQRIQAQHEIVLCFIRSKEQNFFAVPKTLQQDPTFLKQVISCIPLPFPEFMSFLSTQTGIPKKEVISFIQQRLLEETTLTILGLKNTLKGCSAPFFADVFTQHFWMRYLQSQRNFSLFGYLVHFNTRLDESVISAVIKENPKSIQNCFSHSCLNNSFSCKYLSSTQVDQFITEAVRNGLSWRDFKNNYSEMSMEKIADCRTWMLLFVQQDGLNLQYASEALRDHEELVRAAVANNVDAIFFASNRLFHLLQKELRMSQDMRRMLQVELACLTSQLLSLQQEIDVLLREGAKQDEILQQKIEAKKFGDVLCGQIDTLLVADDLSVQLCAKNIFSLENDQYDLASIKKAHQRLSLKYHPDKVIHLSLERQTICAVYFRMSQRIYERVYEELRVDI